MHRTGDTTPSASRTVTLDHPHLQALEDYWRSLRKAAEIPARIDLNPAQIAQVLPYAFILQRVAPGTARFRVAGHRVHDLLRMDPRGMPFSTLFAQEDHDELRRHLERSFSDPAVIGLPLVSAGTLLRPAIEGAVLLLPMRDSAGENTRTLGAIVTQSHHGTRPRRFALLRTARIREERLAPDKPALVSLMPRPQRPRPDAIQRPALRLVVNNG